MSTPSTTSPALEPPVFEPNVYAISPNGGAIPMNSAYYASPATANALAQLYNATSIAAPGSPELPALSRWVTVQVPSTMLPLVASGQVAGMSSLLDLLSLPAVNQQVLLFPNGLRVCAGYLAQYWKNNPAAEFPGLADKMCRAVLKEDGAPGM